MKSSQLYLKTTIALILISPTVEKKKKRFIYFNF